MEPEYIQSLVDKNKEEVLRILKIIDDFDSKTFIKGVDEDVQNHTGQLSIESETSQENIKQRVFFEPKYVWGIEYKE